MLLAPYMVDPIQTTTNCQRYALYHLMHHSKWLFSLPLPGCRRLAQCAVQTWLQVDWQPSVPLSPHSPPTLCLVTGCGNQCFLRRRHTACCWGYGVVRDRGLMAVVPKRQHVCRQSEKQHAEASVLVPCSSSVKHLTRHAGYANHSSRCVFVATAILPGLGSSAAWCCCRQCLVLFGATVLLGCSKPG